MTATHALTLHRPWPWAIIHGSKRVENRSWAPPAWLIGQRLAIHAGKRWDADGADYVESVTQADDEDFASLPDSARDEGVVGMARVVGVVGPSATWRGAPLHAGHLSGGLYQSVWFCGPYGWLLDDVQALREPVPCKGMQGLWRMPLDVAEAVARGCP